MENFELKCETEYDIETLSDHRALDRYVWYQIRNMVKDDLQLGRIIYIDWQGILSVNPNTKLLSDEQKKIASRLIRNQRDGIYRMHQFKDLDKEIKDRYTYRKWFEDEAMNSFMQTIPTKEVFYTQPQDLNLKLKKHSYDEIKRESFNGYSIWQTMYALEFINPFLVAMLRGKNHKIESDFYCEYMGFDYEGQRVYVQKDSINLYKKEGSSYKAIEGLTIHTVLFEHYKESIYKVIYSIMGPIGGSRVLPGEGLKPYPADYDITKNVCDILKSDNYQELDKKYNLSYPRRYWL